MKKSILIACVFALTTGFGAVQAQADQTEKVRQAIAGKTLVHGKFKVKAHRNGRLTGSDGSRKFKGAWTIKEGHWCRTLTEPKEAAGTLCQITKLGDGTLTITGGNGPKVWEIR